MSDPACRFDWFREGYQAVWLYDGTDDWARFGEFCVAIGHAVADAESAAALTDTIERAAADAKLHVRIYDSAR